MQRSLKNRSQGLSRFFAAKPTTTELSRSRVKGRGVFFGARATENNQPPPASDCDLAQTCGEHRPSEYLGAIDGHQWLYSKGYRVPCARVPTHLQLCWPVHRASCTAAGPWPGLRFSRPGTNRRRASTLDWLALVALDARPGCHWAQGPSPTNLRCARANATSSRSSAPPVPPTRTAGVFGLTPAAGNLFPWR